MKQFKINYLAGGLLALAIASCQKNLEKFPSSAIATEQGFQSVRDAKAWNTGLYSNLRGNFYGISMYTQDIQADQLNASIDYGNRNGFPHRWDGFEATEGNINSIWQGYYRALTNINLMLAGFEKIPTNGAAEAAELNRYKGDAYVARAYYYSELIKRYAKPYEPATAATEPGVPLVLVYDVFAKPARASVKAVYDQILSDIAQAKTLLATATGAQGSEKFTIDAVLALEARVRLNMQDWTGAKTAADAVIATGKYPLINTLAAFQNYWYTDTKTEDIMQLYASKTETPNTNSVYLGLNTSLNAFRPDFVPSQWVIDKFVTGDIRRATYFADKNVNFTTGTGTLTLVNKYPGNPALFTATTTNYAHAPKFLRIAEMYLISAEAGARSGNGALEADALIKLNALRSARGLTTPLVVTGTALFNAVKDERFLELAFEGFRLWDLKRWHEGFTRTAPQNTNFLTVGTGFTNLSIPANHPKFQWGLPS
ncbi:MAG: RagB/SusD family nutrient uptake outer membrane protein, partial [Chitinophagaceae bacterium]